MNSSDMDVVVYAPASIGNVSVGFDVLRCGGFSELMARYLVTEYMVKAGDDAILS